MAGLVVKLSSLYPMILVLSMGTWILSTASQLSDVILMKTASNEMSLLYVFLKLTIGAKKSVVFRKRSFFLIDQFFLECALNEK